MKFRSEKKSINSEQLSWCVNQLKPRIENIIASTSYKLLEIFFTKENEINFLRITIDHNEKPITLDDCEEISKKIGKELDKANLIPFSYNLEVQSPGKRRLNV